MKADGKFMKRAWLKEPLTFTPIDMKKQVVKLKHEEFATLNDQQILYVNAYHGMFKLRRCSRGFSIFNSDRAWV